mgnify:CR=1 FL=1
MLRIDCPCCGLRDENEFSYGGDARVKRPAINDTDMQSWYAYIFLRDNERGPHKEFWHHVHGCRQWLIVKRDTLTQEIFEVSLAQDTTSGKGGGQ